MWLLGSQLGSQLDSQMVANEFAPPAAQDGEQVSRYEAVQYHMGTRFSIAVYAKGATAEKAIPAAFERIEEIDHRLSNYRSDSELSRLPHRVGAPQPVSDDLWAVLDVAVEMHRQSHGAFDITVGPLTKLWRRARKEKQLPPQDALQEAMRRTGTKYLVLDRDQQTAQLEREQMALDPGGIAKGWAVQQAVAVLRKHGIQSALVDGGGDMYMIGTPPGREGWRIAVAPLRPGGKPTTTLSLQDRAVATSGDTWQFLEIDGKRYSHILDPKTGMGVTTPSSVTVIAKQGATADAWASAISVLGPQKGLEVLANHPDIEAMIVYLDQQGEIQVEKSKGFDKYVRPKDN